MARHSALEEIIGGVIALVVLIWIFYIFVSTPSILQSYFQSIFADIILGIIIGLIIVGVLVYLKYKGVF